MLDVGCGTGEFLKLARERGCETLGIEPGTTYADFARSEYNLDIINAPWQAARLPAESFDVISCHQVLEHLRDPMAAIAAMSRWLKPDGVLYISVPDMRGNDKPSFERFHFAHIYGFTPETLDAAMRLNGLRPRGAGQSCSTTTLFEKAEDPALEACAIRNSSRAEALRSAYPDNSVTAYVLGGGYFRHAAQRFRKWRADTFHSKVS